VDWRPGAEMPTLRARAALLATVREFFAARTVLEVETPLLCCDTVTEPAVASYAITGEPRRFLQTSPEYAMKRLLAAGSGPIFQISRAFRAGEAGPRHNPEFSLLEWYRPEFDHNQLMSEVAELVTACLGRPSYSKISYRELFREVLNIDPFTADVSQLRSVAGNSLDVSFDSADRDLWLDLLLSHLIEPALVERGVCFVYDYPPSQAALARLGYSDGVEVGHRFELYVDGMELANGYFELTDARQQRLRFSEDNKRRLQAGLPILPLDERLLSALQSGLPECSGVALGLDRLLMCQLGKADIREVLAFDWTRC